MGGTVFSVGGITELGVLLWKNQLYNTHIFIGHKLVMGIKEKFEL